MSEIVSTILAKALLILLEAVIAKLAAHFLRSMRYRQTSSPVVVFAV